MKHYLSLLLCVLCAACSDSNDQTSTDDPEDKTGFYEALDASSIDSDAASEDSAVQDVSSTETGEANCHKSPDKIIKCAGVKNTPKDLPRPQLY